MAVLYCLDARELCESDLFAIWYSRMPQHRRDKIDAYSMDCDRRLSLGAGVLLDSALAEKGIRYEDSTLVTSRYGKPYFPRIGGFSFSISHAGDHAVLAVSDDEVGCDIECTGSVVDSIADRCFTQKERAYITREGTEERKREMFCLLWAAKESYLKALGFGLHIDMKECEVTLDKGISVVHPSFSNEFVFSELYVADGYTCVVSSFDSAVHQTTIHASAARLLQAS